MKNLIMILVVFLSSCVNIPQKSYYKYGRSSYDITKDEMYCEDRVNQDLYSQGLSTNLFKGVIAIPEKQKCMERLGYHLRVE